MNAKKCKALRRVTRGLVREGVLKAETTYQVLSSGSQKRQLLDGNFAFRTWQTIGVANGCARAGYKAAKQEWKRHV